MKARRAKAAAMAEGLVSDQLRDTEMLYRIIGTNHKGFEALVTALGSKDVEAKVARARERLMSKVDDGSQRDIDALEDAWSADATLRLEAGFLLGVAAGRRGA